MIGKDGIFISNGAREKLLFNLSEEDFAELKKQVKPADEGKLYKCFITNQMYSGKEGVFFSPRLMADAIGKTVATSQEVWDAYRLHNTIICSGCSKRFKFTSNVTSCPYCGNVTNAKKYGKKVQFSSVKRTALEVYVNYLRKQDAKK
jgi:hypothetical protein